MLYLFQLNLNVDGFNMRKSSDMKNNNKKRFSDKRSNKIKKRSINQRSNRKRRKTNNGVTSSCRNSNHHNGGVISHRSCKSLHLLSTTISLRQVHHQRQRLRQKNNRRVAEIMISRLRSTEQKNVCVQSMTLR